MWCGKKWRKKSEKKNKRINKSKHYIVLLFYLNNELAILVLDKFYKLIYSHTHKRVSILSLVTWL